MVTEVVVVLGRKEAEKLVDILRRFLDEHSHDIEDFPEYWNDIVFVVDMVTTQVESQLSGKVRVKAITIEVK